MENNAYKEALGGGPWEGLDEEISEKSIKSNTGVPSKSSKKGVRSNKSTQRNKSKKGNKGTPSLVPKTYKLPPALIDSISNIAFWQRKRVQVVVAEAIAAYVETVPQKDKKKKPVEK